jgi:hypothetical protein
MQVIFETVLILVWIWILIELENSPTLINGKFEYKDHITILGIKVCKNFRKPQK